MLTPEQKLESSKQERMDEIELYFNNMIRAGLKVKYGNNRTEDMHVAGGREALFSLKAFLSYYAKIGTTDCIARDPYSKKTHIDTLANMSAMIDEVEAWGMEAYIKNITKQDYIKNQCVTVEQVCDVTWDSTEIDD